MAKVEYSNTDVQPVLPYGYNGSTLAALKGFAPAQYDEIVLSYTGTDLTGVVYKLAAATVATLTLTYTDGKLTGVVKT